MTLSRQWDLFRVLKALAMYMYNINKKVLFEKRGKIIKMKIVYS